MLRLLLIVFACAAFIVPGQALASGGNYAFDGGTPAEQSQVKAALNASTFPWSVIPGTVTVHIAPGNDSDATPGNVYLDPGLLDSGQFAWSTVQHEFGHQVDFSLVNDTERAQLQQALGAQQWGYTTMTLPHSAYGAERFASELSWAYWQSPENALAPSAADNEAGAMPPAAFRTLVSRLLGIPNPSSAPKVYNAKLKVFHAKLKPAKVK